MSMAWIGGITSIAGTIYGATKSQPQNIDPAALGEDALRAQLELAPGQLGAESSYGPAYDALGMNRLQASLFGGQIEQQDPFAVIPNLQAQYDAWAQQVTAEGGKPTQSDYISQRMHAFPFDDTNQQIRQIMAGGTPPGMLDIMGQVSERTGEIQAAANTQQRTADIGDVEALGGRANDAFRAANPELTSTLDALRERAMTAGDKTPLEAELARQAESELALGGQLSPEQQRLVSQSSRAAMGSRGIGRGQNAAIDETLRSLDYSTTLQNQRRGFAGQAASMGMAREQYGTNTLGSTSQLLASTSQDPFQAILGRPSGSVGQGAALFNQGSNLMAGAGPTMFNPFSSDIMSMYAGNAKNQTQAGIATGNNIADLFGGAMGMWGNIYGGRTP